MDAKKLATSATPKKLGSYLVGLAEPMDHGHMHKGSAESVREEEHNGHKIVIRTTYRIEVDGKTVRLPVGVDNNGQVHCHSLPNYQFASAIDMVKTLIDSFPEDFTSAQASTNRPARHGAHSKPSRRKGRK